MVQEQLYHGDCVPWIYAERVSLRTFSMSGMITVTTNGMSIVLG